MKKLSITTCIGLVAALVALVALILFEVSVSTAQGYFDDAYNPLIIALFIGAIVLSLASVALSLFAETTPILAIVKEVLCIGACLCLGFTVGQIIGAIATEFAYTYFSSFNVGTVKEAFMPTACMQALTAVILSLISILGLAIARIFQKSND